MTWSTSTKMYEHLSAGHQLLPYIKLFKKQKEVWNWSPCRILCMVFEEKYSSRYILLPEQISLPDYV